jgi:hypothetical protein
MSLLIAASTPDPRIRFSRLLNLETMDGHRIPPRTGPMRCLGFSRPIQGIGLGWWSCGTADVSWKNGFVRKFSYRIRKSN